jgi:hypothetical protein
MYIRLDGFKITVEYRKGTKNEKFSKSRKKRDNVEPLVSSSKMLVEKTDSMVRG